MVEVSRLAVNTESSSAIIQSSLKPGIERRDFICLDKQQLCAFWQSPWPGLVNGEPWG